MKLEPYGGSGNHNHHDAVPERSLVEKNNAKHGFSPGVAVMTRTVMPVTQGMFLNFRWGVNFPADLGSKLPYLTVNKIALERVEEEKQKNKGSSEASDSDLQMLKGMCFLMRKDLENVEKENREMKRVLDEMKKGVSTRSNGNVAKKLSQQSSESSSGSGEFQRWGSSKNGRQENEQKQPNKSQSAASDLESELQKAIKAASS
ncbi:hypothetical protein SESBI_40698 [Sesbania bispinosa]|nr:hypothetical protein SESBI_40698 [Sesbania bispinosa]